MLRSYRFPCAGVESPCTRVEKHKARREVERGFIYHTKELELYLEGSREPRERLRQTDYRTRFVF